MCVRVLEGGDGGGGSVTDLVLTPVLHCPHARELQQDTYLRQSTTSSCLLTRFLPPNVSAEVKYPKVTNLVLSCAYTWCCVRRRVVKIPLFISFMKTVIGDSWVLNSLSLSTNELQCVCFFFKLQTISLQIRLIFQKRNRIFNGFTI